MTTSSGLVTRARVVAATMEKAPAGDNTVKLIRNSFFSYRKNVVPAKVGT